MITKDKRILSAMLIGISSMMALSTPMTAYASDENDNNISSNNASNQSQQEPITKEVQTETTESDTAINTAETTVDNSTSLILNGGEYTKTEGESSTTETILPANAEDGSPSSQPAIVDFIDATKEVANDNNLQEAENKVGKIKTETPKVETANTNADIAAETIIGNAESIDEQVAFAKKDFSDATLEIASLVANAEAAATPDEAQQYCDQIKQKITATENTYETRKAYVNQLETAYNKAVKDLNDLEGELDESLDKMDTDAGTAQTKIKAAQVKVDALKDTLTAAQTQLDNDTKSATNINNAIEKAKQANNNNDWSNLRPVMQQVIAGYIIPNAESGKAENIHVDPTVTYGFDRQNYNYYKVTYTVNGEEKIKYFNIDRLDKVYNSPSIYTNLGNDKRLGFAIYEKSETEIAANQHLYDYYQAKYEAAIANDESEDDWKWYTQGILKGKGYTNIYQPMANNGTFDVFTDGTIYLTKEEIDTKLAAGEIEVAGAGYRYVNGGKEISKIVQNDNSLIHSGNCQVVATQEQIDRYIDPEKRQKSYVSDALTAYYGSTEEANKVLQTVTNNAIALNDFVTSAGSFDEQYDQYSALVNDVDKAVKKAAGEVNELNEAIDELKENRGNRIIKQTADLSKLAELLGVSIDALMDKSQGQIIAELNQKVKEAKEELSKLELTLDALKTVQTELQNKIDNQRDDDDDDNSNDVTNNNEDNTIPQNTSQLQPKTKQTESTQTESQPKTIVRTSNRTVVKAEDNKLVEAVTPTPTTETKTSVTIEDPDVAKAAMPEKEDAVPAGLDWFWIIIIALLGSTGVELYHQYKKKKEREDNK